MPIPFILAGAAIAAAGTGIKKGLDAKEKNERAERIVKRAKRKFNETKDLLDEENEILKNRLQDYGKFKIDVFNTIIRDFLTLMKDCAHNVNSEAEIKKYLTKEEIIELEQITTETLEISSSLSKGVASGAVTAFGVYGTVGALASASTGTAIASLSGAAATNATLAWLGGGALSAGGLGIAGGTAVLGGLVAGPAIAVAGFMMDNKAESNLSNAVEFESDVEVKIETMKKSIDEFKIIQNYVDESQKVITDFIERYKKIKDDLFVEQERVYNDLYQKYIKKREKLNNSSLFYKLLIFLKLTKEEKEPIKPPLCQLNKFEGLIHIISSLKNILQAPIIEGDSSNKKFIEIVEKAKIEMREV